MNVFGGRAVSGAKSVLLRAISASFYPRALLLAYILGAILCKHMGAYAGSSDTSGYMNNARILASGELHPLQRTIEGLPASSLPPMSYVPLGFHYFGKNRMYPTYSLGLSFLIFLASKIVGWSLAAPAAMWLLAMGCLSSTYFLFRELQFSREVSLLGTLFLGGSPLFLFMSLQTMSDMPATLFATCAILASLKSQRASGSALLAGALFALGIFVRPTSILMAVPIALFFPWSVRNASLFVAGAAPFLALLAVANHELYGSVATTGYGDVLNSFGTRFVPSTLKNYWHSVPIELTPLVVVVLLAPFLRGAMGWRIIVALASWVIVFFSFYAVYFCTHESWWYLRFVLPAYPALIALMLIPIALVGCTWPRASIVMWLLLVIGTIKWDKRWATDLYALNIGDGERVYPETSKYLNSSAPQNAVIICMQESGALFYYTKNVILRWDFLDSRAWNRVVETCKASGRPVFMVLFPFERDEALNKFDQHRWHLVKMVRDVSIWQLDVPAVLPATS